MTDEQLLAQAAVALALALDENCAAEAGDDDPYRVYLRLRTRLSAGRDMDILRRLAAGVTAVTRFDAEDRFEIAGRGTILTGPYPFDCRIKDAIGRKIVFGAIVYEVRGVEWNLVREPQFGDPAGILVR